MKTPHILIIFIFMSIVIFCTNLSEVHAVSGSAYFMKSNSTAKIYADFTIHTLSNQSFNIRPEILTSLDNLSTKPSGLTIDAKPDSFVENMHHMHITYTITAKDSVKGVYPLFLFFCGTSPLVVGFNESEVNPVIYNKFFTAAYSCPAISTDTPDMNIIGYSGIISKTLSIDPNNTITVTSVSTLGPPLPTPLNQFKSGIAAKDVKCEQGLELIFKFEDGSPACVKQETISKFVERGWALDQVQQKSKNIATNSSSALKLSLSTNSTIIQSGHAIGITLSLDNTRSSLLNLNSQNNWPIQGLDSGGCSWLPMGIAILDGYYTAQNMSDGHPMLLHFLYPCPPSLPVKTFTFQPMSSNITVTCEPGNWAPCQYLTQTKTSVAYSSFLQDGKFFDFNPGNYTLVAGDEWGDSAIQHFQVVNSTRTHIEYDPPIVTQTYDIHGTVKDIMPNTTFAKLASSSTGIQMAHGEGLDTYDNDSIKLELNYGNTSDSHVISATVENLGKRTVYIYDIFISGFIPLANDDHLNFVVVRGDPYVVSKDDAILEPGESVTKYIVGNWAVDGILVNGFSAGTSYSYDDLQNFDGITNGYSMSIPVQWVK
ncbi:MAG: hypothetical protein KGH99_03695 [Thaumarchaeota archaeon]|nr:hypothetical protein [Nitrososphaerota archaeon]